LREYFCATESRWVLNLQSSTSSTTAALDEYLQQPTPRWTSLWDRISQQTLFSSFASLYFISLQFVVCLYGFRFIVVCGPESVLPDVVAIHTTDMIPKSMIYTVNQKNTKMFFVIILNKTQLILIKFGIS